MDHCTSNGLSVMAVDTASGHVAGVLVVKDFQFTPPQFKETFQDDTMPLSYFMRFITDLDEKVTQKLPELTQEGKAADLWLLSVTPSYRGNKIAHSLVQAALSLVRKTGITYATIEAVSAFTSKAAEKNKFTALHREQAEDWTWEGENYYRNTKQPHGLITFWIKNMREGEDQKVAQ